MAENKNQHFVPRFHLENFSFDGGNRFHLLHLTKEELRKGIGIREQCAANYFYGKDLKIEKTFQELEGAVAQSARTIVRETRMPVPGSDGDIVFRTHVALQWGRTRAHINQQREMSAKTMETVFGRNREGKSDFEKDFEATTFEDTMRMSVENSADLAAFIGDLGSKLIDADGLGEFVTSDTPVVMLNPYYLGRYPGGTTGLGVQGLIVLLPISPRYLAFYYDRTCYRVGSPHQRTIPLAAADLVALNNYQCLNAEAVVYFHKESIGPGLLAAFRKVKALRLTERHGVRMGMATTPDGPQEIVHTYRKEVNYRPHLSFLSILRKRKGVREDVGRIPQREPCLAEMYRQYHEEVLDGRRERSFLRYLAELGPIDAQPTTPAGPSGGRTAVQVLESLVRNQEAD